LVLIAPWRALVEPDEARATDAVRPILAQAVSH
jgi:hypothetical protein